MLAAMVAQPRGGTTAKMGGVAVQAIGNLRAGKEAEAGEAAGSGADQPMPLA